MKLLFAVAVGVLFGTGAFLLLKQDLVRVVAGIVLISQSAVLTLMAAGQRRGAAPIHPLPDGPISDPLVQAMALTAIVISLAVTALLLAMVHRLFVAYRVVERDDPEATASVSDAEPEAAADGQGARP